MIDTNIHLLPCKIDYNGEANIKDYFIINEETNFRGRLLKSRKVNLNENGLKGLILLKKENDQEHFKIEKEFKDYLVWEHDVLPKSDSPYINVDKWFKMAEVLHGDE
ncbi:ribonuclease H1 small subunit [Neoconidiobolus thromboides FSU 785]|nr:ribonuclease H1 small subunit [Neoconidiobolus thromboides FSU 785]